MANEPIHLANVSLNLSLNEDQQMLTYQSLDTSTAQFLTQNPCGLIYFWFRKLQILLFLRKEAKM